MILDVPTTQDFLTAGKDFLCIAWDTACRLSLGLEDGIDDDPSITDEYWAAAQRPLSTAISLLQQGIEFILKAGIAATSPYLLIANEPSGWPRDSRNKDIRFTDFKTIDAKDLVRVYNSVSTMRLTDDFVARYERLRIQRNTIMHTVDKNMRFSSRELILDILEAHRVLLPSEKWTSTRRESLFSDPEQVLYGSDREGLDYGMIRELAHVIHILKPAEAKLYFCFDKKQRRYFCPKCYFSVSDLVSDSDDLPRLALLAPNAPVGNNLYCFVCDENTPILRAACKESDCKGNVICKDEQLCLTCLASQ
jgi:hypothetical protein